MIVFVFIRELEKHRVNSATDIAKKRQEAESAVSIREHNAYRPFNRVYNWELFETWILKISFVIDWKVLYFSILNFNNLTLF